MTAPELLAIKAPGDHGGKDYSIIQVTNLSTKASDKQIGELFAQIGAVTHVEIFPKDKHRNKFGVLVAFIEYEDHNSVYIAQHLTSTVFIDKPIVVIPVPSVPSEYEALQLAAAMATTRLDSDNNGVVKQLVSTIAPTIPSNIANPMLGNKPQTNLLIGGLLQTKDNVDSSKFVDPSVELIASTGVPLPKPPKLAEDYSSTKEKEVRRTVFVDNLNPYLTAEHLLNYFQFCGDIRYLRIGGDDMPDKRFAFIQFVDLASVNVALQYDGADFCDRRIRITHSRHWLQKPPTKRTEAERENDLIMQRLLDAQARIENACKEDPKQDSSPKRHKKSRSRSRSRRKHRSRSRSRRKSRDRSRDKSKKSKKSRKHSKSRERKRSSSRSRRSRSRDKRSRSRDKRRRSRDRR